MGKIVKVQEVTLKNLKPYENNAKIHGEDQIAKIKDSIKEFGFLTPCLIDNDYNIIAGHGRVMAAKSLGMETVPCVFVEGLTDEQRRAYILVDNKLADLSAWNFDLVDSEIEAIEGIDMSAFGFELQEDDFNLDELFVDSEPTEKKPQMIQCPHCGEWFEQ